MDYIATRDIKATNGAFDVPLSARSSVRKLRDRLRNIQHTHPSPESNHARIIQSLAEALLNRFNGVSASRQDDLHQAIWYFEHALALTPPTSYQYLEIILGLSTSLYSRFQLFKQVNDQKRLLQCLVDQRKINFDALLAPVKQALLRQSNSVVSTADSMAELVDDQDSKSYSQADVTMRPTEGNRSELFSYCWTL